MLVIGLRPVTGVLWLNIRGKFMFLATFVALDQRSGVAVEQFRRRVPAALPFRIAWA